MLVQIAQKLFVATAAHCMAPGVLIADERGFSIPLGPSKVNVVNRKADQGLDFGFLEIKPDERFQSLSKSYCSPRQLSTETLPVGGMCHVVGYLEESMTATGETLEVVKQGFGSTYQEQEDGYLLFPYPKEGWTHGIGLVEWERAKFHNTPKGFSGGGLWAFLRPKQDELFVPERHVKLMGIQSSWWPERR